ncbi:MAG: glycosyltransferase [Ignavibacteria bacterium]|nr:glycosyltransferase [Ignavibacteria bacterium]
MSKEKVRYSIIIPTLNEEKLLPQLLKQLNEPSLKENYSIEIILSDGGSVDKTIDLAIPYVDRIKVHTDVSQQNIASGRNEGAEVAEGEILIFINADIRFDDVFKFFDYLESNFVNTEYSGMACKVQIFKEEEIFSDKIFHGFYNWYFRLMNICGMGMGRGECQVVKRKVFNDMNGYNSLLAAGEDFDLFRRIRMNGKILFTNEISVYESPRRYRKYGYINVSSSWFFNSVSVVLKNKSLSKVWEQVR